MRTLREILNIKSGPEKNITEMYDSLQKAVKRSGSSDEYFGVSRLELMTAAELIEQLGPKGVLFTNKE